VSTDGIITGIASGNLVVTASVEGQTATSTITVSSANISGITAGATHTCAWTTAGKTYCWGGNSFAQSGVSSSVPALIFSDEPFGAITATGHFSCGIRIGGEAKCWGDNRLGQLGISQQVVSTGIPTSVIGGQPYRYLAYGSNFLLGHMCGISQSGRTFCWGNNSSGQVGDGSFQDRYSAVSVIGGDAFTQITVGYEHTCALSDKGEALCWGKNLGGQLGTGSSQAVLSQPTLVITQKRFTSIAAGLNFTCALETSDSLAYCWGFADGFSSNTPQPISSNIKFASITAGSNHACGIALDGFTYCWGYNQSGQLGDATRQSRWAAGRISGDFRFTHLSAGYDFTCGATQVVILCWGFNYYGQLGEGTTALRLVPTLARFP
jgi:alpha-tubulin suppressor-like RCC1 family protein